MKEILNLSNILENRVGKVKNIVKGLKYFGGMKLKKIGETEELGNITNRSLLNQEEGVKSEKCFVCMEGEIGSFFAPCNHTGVCQGCAFLGVLQNAKNRNTQELKCYICKEAVEKIYFFDLKEDGSLIGKVMDDSVNFLKEKNEEEVWDIFCADNE